MNEACTLGQDLRPILGPGPGTVFYCNLSVPGVGAQRFQSTPCKVRSLCLSLGLSGPVMTAAHVKCQCINPLQNIERNCVQHFWVAEQPN